MIRVHVEAERSIKGVVVPRHNLFLGGDVISQDVSSSLQEWKRYEYLFKESKDMIFYFSSTGLVKECNSSVYEQLGFDRSEEIWLQDIFRTCIKVYDDRLIFKDGMFEQSFETTIYRKNQTCFPVELRIAMLSEDTGRYGVCRAFNIIKKVDAERKLACAKEEIEEVNKERNEMVANVTHELRTPVNGVMGLAQNLLETELSDSQRETVELIDHCCKNMIEIINNILDFSKLQANKFTIENREFSFHQMMDKFIKTNQPTVEAKGLKLVCNVAEDIPDKLISDELRLTQILNNLLSNAVKFTSVGQIVIKVIKSMDFPEEMELFFMVIDSGIGISEDDKDKLFKSFSQVDASITRRFGGTGLGLSIVKNLVRMMGGDVNVESEKGKGSTFSFSVRVKKVQQEEEEAVPVEVGTYSFQVGAAAEDDDEDISEIFRLGSDENRKAIESNMERLVLCIEMENWDKADTFAENIKQLVAEDVANLKRKAFRLQMTLRRGNHELAIQEYKVLEEAIQKIGNDVMQEGGK